jgi:uncharacterized RDD family membrane protein YckC
VSTAVPTIPRRLACVLYESLLLSAVLLVAAFPFVALIQGLEPPVSRALLRVYLLLVSGFYFTLFWRRGQTLAMKTWGMRIESVEGGPPSLRQAWQRYLVCCLTLPFLGAGWWFALFTLDRQFLQDRLAGTRLCRV